MICHVRSAIAFGINAIDGADISGKTIDQLASVAGIEDCAAAGSVNIVKDSRVVVKDSMMLRLFMRY